MNVPSDDDGPFESPSEKAADFLRGYLEKHPKFLQTVAIAFVGLIVIALIVVALASTKQ